MFPRRTAGKWSPISASGWNAAMLSAEDFLERQRTAGEAPRFDAGLNRTVIQVRNATGSAMQRGYILGLGDWSFDPDDGQQLEELQETLCVEGVEPVAGTHEDQFVVLPTDLADGEIGEAILTGLVLVTVDISDTTHKYCTIADGVVANLKSATSGRGRILKAQDGAGSKYCLVELRSDAASITDVQVWKSTGSPAAGDPIAANADGLHEGRLRDFGGGSFSTGANVWLRFTDWEDDDAGSVIAEHARYFTGFAAGSITSGGVEKPLYLAQVGEQTFLAKPPTGGLTKGSSGACKLMKRDKSDSGLTKTAEATLAALTDDTKFCIVSRLRTGIWIAAPGEC